MATYLDGIDGGKHGSDNIEFLNTYKVVFSGFTEKNGLITEEDYYKTDAYSVTEAVSYLNDVNEDRDSPLYDIKIVSVSLESK